MEAKIILTLFNCGWSFCIDINKKISIEPYNHYKERKTALAAARRWLIRLNLTYPFCITRVVG
jgi:hypothetical protein